MVRRAATAERDAAVGGALAVDDQVAGVGERLPPGEPDLVPLRRAAAARCRPSASTAGRRRGGGRGTSPCTPRWPARRRRRGPTRRSSTSRRGSTPSTGGVLVQRTPASTRPRGEPVDEPQRVDGGAVRRVQRAERAGGRPTRGELVGGQPAQVVRRRTRTRGPRRCSARTAGRAGPACGRASPCRPLPAGVVVRAARTRPTSSTVSCIARCTATAAARPCARGERAQARRQQRRAPPAVAAAGAEPDVSRSSTAMRSAGSRLASESAVHRPV